MTAVKVKGPSPFMVQYQDLSSSLTRISVMRLGTEDFTAVDWLEGQPVQSTSRDAVRTIAAIVGPASAV